MKIIKNNIIPLKGFAAINLFGVLFVRKNVKITAKLLRHEAIHTEQIKEMLYIFFYIWYGIEWIINFIKYRDAITAYYNIRFEREAYQNEDKIDYLSKRMPFTWMIKNK